MQRPLASLRSEYAETTAFVPLQLKFVPRDTNVQPASRSQSINDDYIHDEEYIRRTNEVPTDSEYPETPESINANPKCAVHNTPRPTFKLRSEYVDGIRPGVFRCLAYVDVAGGEQILGVGEGMRKVSLLLDITHQQDFAKC